MASLLDCGKTKSPRWSERGDELAQNAGVEQGINRRVSPWRDKRVAAGWNQVTDQYP
jgi:hypothetical protein